VGNRCADHVTPLYLQKLALTSPTGGDRSVGIVRSRTKNTEFSFTPVHVPGDDFSWQLFFTRSHCLWSTVDFQHQRVKTPLWYVL